MPPQRFEAGTQMVAQAVGMGAAAEYLRELGMDAVAAHETLLTERLLAGIAELDGVRVIGPTTPDERLAVVSFVVDGVHAHDVGPVSYTHLRAHETPEHLVCRLLLEKKNQTPAATEICLSSVETQKQLKQQNTPE